MLNKVILLATCANLISAGSLFPDVLYELKFAVCYVTLFDGSYAFPGLNYNLKDSGYFGKAITQYIVNVFKHALLLFP